MPCLTFFVLLVDGCGTELSMGRLNILTNVCSSSGGIINSSAWATPSRLVGGAPARWLVLDACVFSLFGTNDHNDGFIFGCSSAMGHARLLINGLRGFYDLFSATRGGNQRLPGGRILTHTMDATYFLWEILAGCSNRLVLAEPDTQKWRKRKETERWKSCWNVFLSGRVVGSSHRAAQVFIDSRRMGRVWAGFLQDFSLVVAARNPLSGT